MNKPQATKDDSARSPFAGCLIFTAALAVMVFLIGFSVLTLFRQFNEIAKFTEVKPAPVGTTALENRESELNSLAERIETFRQQLAGEEDATLALTADDINLAIAAYEPFKELRDTFRVTTIGDGKLRAAISFPLNGKPRLTQEGESGWITSDSRYLNGTLVTIPQLLKREVVLGVENIEVPGKTVAAGFIDQMSPYRITERYLTDSMIGPAMGKLTRVEITGANLVLTRKKGEVPADTITNAQVDSASTRLFTTLGIAAAVFLAFVALIILIGMRAKRRKSRTD
jgi:hypothetical protein